MQYQVNNFKLKYHRIKIETTYPNSKKGALVIETPFLFSFGVNERLNQETNQLTDYSIPVCLWQRGEETTDKKGKTKKKKDETAAPVLYTKLIYSDKSKKIPFLFRSKGNDRLNLDQS